jgi:ubiquinone biosynthesis protein UbiJ
MIFKTLLIAALETAINRYLALDENHNVLLYPLIGKTIAVHIEPFNETLYFCPSADSIQILDQITGEADTTITGSAWALGLMGVSAKPMRSVFTGDIRIEGNIHIGKQFQDIFKHLDVNLETLLSQYTGQEMASRMTGLFRAGRDWGKTSIETFKLNTAEFLQEETRDLPAQAELDHFLQQVDDVRNDYDRLVAHVERLSQSLTKKQKE